MNDDEYTLCECEPDLSCPLHRDRPPWIDRRYQGLDAEEAHAYGAWWDL